ncbi:MAG: hypothetical protein WDW36_010079 [Sanguina aurantia]
MGAAVGQGRRWQQRLREPGGGEVEEEANSDQEEAEQSQEEDEDEQQEGGKDEAVLDAGVSDMDYLRARMRSWDDDDDDDVGVDVEEAGAGPPSRSHKGNTPALKPKSTPAAAPSKATAARHPSTTTHTSDAVMRDARTDAHPDGGSSGGAPAPPVAVAVVVEAGDVDSIGENGRLFIRNLAYSTTETDLSEYFGQWGDLEEVHLVHDRDSRKSKGIAYVLFRMPQDALTAYRAADGTIFQGRLIHVIPARSQPSQDKGRSEYTFTSLPGTGAASTEPGALNANPLDDQGDWGLSAEDLVAAKGADVRAGVQGGQFKTQREASRKADAGNRAAWNTLFMRADTVAEAVAAHYGVTKSELLDRGSSDLPVRMALGEAHVLAATKSALQEAGVAIDRLEAAAAASGKASAHVSVARSTCVLLVKNLPYSTDEAELSALFSRMGPLGRLVLPPTKTLAIVEYLEASHARSAFKALAYKKFQHVPLYLEWAPAHIFEVDAPPTPTPAPPAKAAAVVVVAAAAAVQPQAAAVPVAAKAAVGAAAAAAKQEAAGVAGKAKAVAVAAAPVGKAAPVSMAELTAPSSSSAAAATAGSSAAEAGDDDGSAQGTLYIKNLAFATTDESLKKHFDKIVSSLGGTLHSARVSRRKGPDGGLLSCGYGFVEVAPQDVAALVIKKLQGSVLDKHKLVLQLSQRKAPAANTTAATAAAPAASKSAAGPASSSTAAAKLVVRNLAFEATRKEVAALFAPFGHMKSCRLPKKFDGSHRGFAFVEFTTKQEARAALEGAGGVHLYGRRLVVEYAAEEGGLEEVRAKTAARFRKEEEEMAAAAPGAKRLRKGL